MVLEASGPVAVRNLSRLFAICLQGAASNVQSFKKNAHNGQRPLGKISQGRSVATPEHCHLKARAFAICKCSYCCMRPANLSSSRPYVSEKSYQVIILGVDKPLADV